MFQHSHRIRNLVIAAALAAAAAGLTVLADARSGGGARAEAAPGASVLVATRDLAVGEPAAQALADGSIAARTVPAGTALPGAATASGLRGLVVVQPVYRGEQVTSRRLGPSGASGLRSELRGALRVLRVPGDANQLLAGLLQAGDHVDVVASLKVGQQQTAQSRIVLRNLLVLEPAASASHGVASAGSDSLAATVELTGAQAQRLFYVLENGGWSFVLRPPADASDTATPAETAAGVLAGR